MSLRQRVAAVLSTTSTTDYPDCPACQQPVRTSHDRVRLEDDTIAHRRCARYLQAVGRAAYRPQSRGEMRVLDGVVILAAGLLALVVLAIAWGWL